MIPALAICILYGASATLVNVCSKLLTTSYAFKCTYTVRPKQFLTCQSLLVVAGTEVGKLFGWQLVKFSWRDLTECSLMSLLFTLNLAAGLLGLSRVNMPMYIALRKQVTIIVFLWDSFVLKKEIRGDLLLGVAGMTLGAVIAGVRTM